jgi:RimJ/RimL family protein N-acetyltransferase
MTAEVIAGHDVLLVPVDPDRVDDVLGGELDGRTAGPGWPHADTAPALAFAIGGGLTWLIVDGDDRVVGELGTKTAPDGSGRVEIGYGLAASSRRRGLGTHAVAALVGWLGGQPDVAIVQARVDPTNEPSVRLLRRLGFTCVSRARGEDVYELTAPPP